MSDGEPNLDEREREGPWAYIVKLEYGTKRTRKEGMPNYLAVQMPTEIEELWPEGTEDRPYVWLITETESFGDNTIHFVKGGVLSPDEFSDEPSGPVSDPEFPGRFKYKILRRSEDTPKYKIRFPNKWRDDLPEHPLYQAEHHEEVIVEINPAAEEFRWYDPADYIYRANAVMPLYKLALLQRFILDAGRYG